MINMVAVDPSTTNIGVAIYKIDKHNFNIVDIESFTIELDDTYHIEDKLDYIYRYFINLFNTYNPINFVHEDAFIHIRRPMAFKNLILSIHSMRRAFREYNGSYYGMYHYPPKTVKKFMMGGDASKEDMRDAVKSIDEISNIIGNEINNITEHEIDAISIGYLHLYHVRREPFILVI